MKKKLEKRIAQAFTRFFDTNLILLRKLLWFVLVGAFFLLLYESDWTVIDPNQEALSIKELIQLEFARFAGFFAIVNFVNKILK